MEKMQRLVVMFVVAAAVAFVGVQIAAAQEMPGAPEPSGIQSQNDPQKIFESMDTDKDGKISAKEYTRTDGAFSRMDANHDGFLTVEELKAGLAAEDQGRRNARREGPPREAARGQRGQFDPARMMDNMVSRYKETLGSTDEEWKAIEPLLKKVLEARMQARIGGFGRRPGGESAAGANPEADALRSTLDSQKATPDEIKAKLAAFRASQKKKDEALQKAREDLRKVLTVKQEANLVLSGVLD
jgi:Ca2+-binding EF-hand superfamily protein